MTKLQLKAVSAAASKFSALLPRSVPGANPGHEAACATPLQRLFAGGAAAGAAAAAASSAAEGILAYTGGAAGGAAEALAMPRMPQPPPDPRPPAADREGGGRASPAPRRKTRLSGGGGRGGGRGGGEPASSGMFPPLSMGSTAVSSMSMAAQHAIDDVSESGLATTRFVTAPQGVQRGGPAAQSAAAAAAAPAAAAPRRGSPRPAADGGSEERPPSGNGRPPSGNGRPPSSAAKAQQPPRRSLVGAAVAADGQDEDFSSKAAVPSHLPRI